MFSFAADGDVWAGASEDVEGELAEDGEVLGAVVLAVAGAVLVEDGVEDPVEAVLDPPMGTHRAGERLGRQLGRGQVVAPAGAGPAVPLDGGLDHGDAGEARRTR